MPPAAGRVVLEEGSEKLLIGAGGLGGTLGPVQDDDLAQVEVGDQRYRLGGQDGPVTTASRNAGHLGQDADGRGMESEFGLVQDYGSREIGPQ